MSLTGGGELGIGDLVGDFTNHGDVFQGIVEAEMQELCFEVQAPSAAKLTVTPNPNGLLEAAAFGNGKKAPPGPEYPPASSTVGTAAQAAILAFRATRSTRERL